MQATIDARFRLQRYTRVPHTVVNTPISFATMIYWYILVPIYRSVTAPKHDEARDSS